MGFPGGSEGKESACNAGDWGLIPGLGRSPGEGTHSTIPESDTTEQLSLFFTLVEYMHVVRGKAGLSFHSFCKVIFQHSCQKVIREYSVN